jgi:hypothetical protein
MTMPQGIVKDLLLFFTEIHQEIVSSIGKTILTKRFFPTERDLPIDKKGGTPLPPERFPNAMREIREEFRRELLETLTVYSCLDETGHICSECGCVDPGSRLPGFKFRCLHCGYEGSSDSNVDKNLRLRKRYEESKDIWMELPPGAESNPNAPYSNQGPPEDCPECGRPNSDKDGNPLCNSGYSFCSEKCAKQYESQMTNYYKVDF